MTFLTKPIYADAYGFGETRQDGEHREMGRKRVRHAVRWPIGDREVVIKATAKLHQPGAVRAHQHPDRRQCHAQSVPEVYCCAGPTLLK